jgi:hypothetical protein
MAEDFWPPSARGADPAPAGSATPGPPKSLPGIQGAVRQLTEQSAHTYKPMYVPAARTLCCFRSSNILG